MQFLKFESQNEIGVLTIHRPESLNALNRGVLEELDSFLTELEQSRTVRVLIVTGSGEKAFVAGADIKEIDTLTKATANDFAGFGQNVFLKLEKLYCPVIAAINGFTLGGGLELALACDFMIASEKSKFGLPECTLGLIPGFGGTVRLARKVSVAMAKQWTMTGEMISAATALQYGLVNKVVAPEDVMKEAQALAATMAQRSAQALRLIKESINKSYGLESRSAMTIEKELFASVFGTNDQKEGTKAFIEKRKPVFKDM